MNKYLISLDKDVQRRELFFAQPDTADFVVFSAINTMQKEWNELAEVFNPTKFEQHYGRNVTKGEIGCTLSHLAVYRQIVEDQNVTENDYALVCEDDALFNSNLSPKTIALLTEKCDADIVLIGQSKIAEFDDVELEINYPTTFSFLRQTSGDVTVAYPYKSYFAGTVASNQKNQWHVHFETTRTKKKPFWLADDFLLFETQFQINNNVVRHLWPLKIN